MIGGFASYMGIGGGIFFVPFLGVVVGLGPREARGTSLGIVACVAGVALLGYLAVYLVNGTQADLPALEVAALVAPFSILASRYAATWVPRLPVAKLQVLFAVVLLLASVKLLDEQLGCFSMLMRSGDGLIPHDLIWAFFALPVLGLVVGAVSSLVGVGGALLLIPAFDMLFTDLSFKSCQATALLIVLPTALFAFMQHKSQGTAFLGPVIRLAPLAMLGSVLGSYFLNAESTDSTLRLLFGCFMLFIALATLISVLRGSRNADRAARGC